MGPDLLELRRLAGRMRRGISAWVARSRRLWPIRLRLWWRGLPKLAPGRLPLDDRSYQTDHRFLTRQAHEYGPLFKTMISGEMVTCSVDHRRSRALLVNHEARLGLPYWPYSALVPGGFMHSLVGDEHRRMRRVFVHAVRPALVNAHEDVLRALAHDGLAALADIGSAAGPGDLVAALERIATEMLLVVFYGLRPGDPDFALLRELHAGIGPRGFDLKPEAAQHAAFAELMAAARGLFAASGEFRPCVQRSIADAEPAAPLADSVLGNLIMMVEMGRYDVRGLMRWIVKYLSDAPEVVAAIRAERGAKDGATTLAAATVMESLRLGQSEALIRHVTADIEFEGHTIPAGSFARACLREAHLDPAVFPEPERFDPSRFVARDYTANEFSPFGLDHRICLAGDIVIRLGTIFVDALVGEFDWRVLADGPRHHGAFLWEPSPRFAIRLAPRAA